MALEEELLLEDFLDLGGAENAVSDQPSGEPTFVHLPSILATSMIPRNPLSAIAR